MPHRTFTNADWTAEDEQSLADLRARLSTFSIRRFSVPALVETVTLEVTIDRDADPGERELRLQTESGLSNPLVFCVGQLPEVAEKSGRSIAQTESRRERRSRPKETKNRET